MKRPDEYRKNAADALREAQAAPESMRLNLIVIAQQWLELADKAAQRRREKEDEDREPSGGSASDVPSEPERGF